MKYRLILPFILLAFTCGNLRAQFSLSGEIRPRSEYRHGYKTPAEKGQDPAFFISQRTRLDLQYTRTRLAFRLQLQDIRTWGSTAQLNLSDNLASVHQAWAEYAPGKGFSIRLGRQELVYDDHRIFGNVGWAQQGRSHDLALLKWEQESWKMHMGLAYNQDMEQFNTTLYTVENYKSMQFVWLNYSEESYSLSVLFLNNGVQSNATPPTSGQWFSQTAGSFGSYRSEVLGVQAAAYIQSGRDPYGRRLRAYMLSGEASYGIGLKNILGFQLISGSDSDRGPSSGSALSHSFTPLYGTNHKFNGHMDYFFVGNHLHSVGLTDLYTGAQVPVMEFTGTGTIHFFQSYAKIADPVTPGLYLSPYLGTEIDLSLSWKPDPEIEISLGYSQMFGTSSMEVLKGGDHGAFNNWAWLMLSFTPGLFSAGNQIPQNNFL